VVAHRAGKPSHLPKQEGQTLPTNDSCAARNSTSTPTPLHVSDGWDDVDGRPAAWKAFGEPATSAPVFGIGAPYLPISSTSGGIQ
jgi:hypothetical protein